MVKSQDTNPRTLDRIYFCDDCDGVFLFAVDVEEHERDTGHRKMLEMPFNCVSDDQYWDGR